MKNESTDEEEINALFPLRTEASIAAHEAQRQAGQEPYAYAVYFPDQPSEELVHDLDDLSGDLTNREHTITPLYTAPQPVIPKGYVLAPLEPTPEMVQACDAKYVPRIALPIYVAAYKTMLAAAPQPITKVVKPLTTEQIEDAITNWFAEDWAIEKARGLLWDLGIGEVKP